ncbi:30327_t:CDS:2, partial [Gigaspora margarita]
SPVTSYYYSGRASPPLRFQETPNYDSESDSSEDENESNISYNTQEN